MPFETYPLPKPIAMSLLFGLSYRPPAGGRSRLLWRGVLEAQRLRRTPPVESGTCARRTPFCGCSSVEQLQSKADFAFAGSAGDFGVSVAGADGAVHVAGEAQHRGAGLAFPRTFISDIRVLPGAVSEVKSVPFRILKTPLVHPPSGRQAAPPLVSGFLPLLKRQPQCHPHNPRRPLRSRLPQSHTRQLPNIV